MRAQRAGEAEHLALHPTGDRRASTARAARRASRRRPRRRRRVERGVATVARPVRLHHVPLLGGHADELLEATGEVLGDAPHIVAQAAPALDGQRRADPHEVLPVRPEVDRGRDQRRAGPQRERRRARRAAWCVSPKNSTAMPSPAMSRSASRQTTRFSRSARITPRGRLGPERDDLHPDRTRGRRRTTRTAPAARPARPRPRAAARARPATPAAKSNPPRCGQREDHALARLERRR